RHVVAIFENSHDGSREQEPLVVARRRRASDDDVVGVTHGPVQRVIAQRRDTRMRELGDLGRYRGSRADTLSRSCGKPETHGVAERVGYEIVPLRIGGRIWNPAEKSAIWPHRNEVAVDGQPRVAVTHRSEHEIRIAGPDDGIPR